MKEFNQTVANMGLVYLLLVVLCLFQTALWFQVFHPIPPPNLWLPIIVYVTIYRRIGISLLTLVLLGFTLITLSSKPVNLFFLSLLAVALTTHLVRMKFFWTGSSYFLMSCLISIFSYHVFSWLLSFNLEANFLRSPRWGAWLMEFFLTPIIAPLLYSILKKIDQLTDFQEPGEFGFRRL
ncbi:MAG: hypothetical protein SGJ18_11650 [Pseudomonadota bacterium]|nr:hypothetical protein [Pseudomonadota bacterium]